ncbi:MAG: glycerol-3-phosphate 1-O-acyltransferase PlsY [Eubacteriales bacterium]
MERLISIVIGYIFGCFQTGYFIGRLNKRVDIRQHGSGNAGTTNAIRVLGWKAGFYTFLGDFLKAIITILLIRLIYDDNVFALYGGLGVVLGHNFPFFLKFKGGKGMAATAGVFFAFDYRIGLIGIALFIIIVAITRFVSIGSLLMSTWMPIGIYIFHEDNYELLILGLGLMALAYIRHRANISRLLNGEENKLGHKKDA